MRIGTPAGWAVLQSRDFRLFCSARFLSALARQMQNVAVGLFVYDLTHSAWALGIAGLFAFAPALLFAFFTGHVADTFDRRLVVTAAHTLAGVSAAGLFACSWFGIGTLWPVYGLIALAGVSRAFGNPATNAMVPNLVPREEFGHAVGWDSSVTQTATISGPAVGGLLYALNPSVAFAAAALAYALAALFIAAVKVRTVKRAKEKMSWATLAAGLTFIRSQPVVLGAITLDLMAVLLGGVSALLPIFAEDILHVGAWGVGFLRSMQALGALCMASFLAHRPIRAKAGVHLLRAVAVYGVATIGFGLSTNLVVSLGCLFAVGAADMVSLVIRQTLVQIDTPDAMRGRVSAVNTMFTGASNSLGEFESGALAALIGAVPTVILGGAASVLLAILWSRTFPRLRERDHLVPEPSQQAAVA
jgi:MFS family permease